MNMQAMFSHISELLPCPDQSALGAGRVRSDLDIKGREGTPAATLTSDTAMLASEHTDRHHGISDC